MAQPQCETDPAPPMDDICHATDGLDTIQGVVVPGIDGIVADAAARARGERVLIDAPVGLVIADHLPTCEVVHPQTHEAGWCGEQTGARVSGVAAARRAKKKRQNKARRGGR